LYECNHPFSSRR